ncbi:hypothetical protein EV645_3925 [Kribbella rubisoli]|uniref:Uncharacterized protein n=1 Tax=Kribbella rubisoli TaxID=3075929 RepID=A0A4Q7X175_9ACTN|nr:hypothetical protein [Kribbella rubisoli]RZU16368.1 hypothetical protein EV645_3925 [Kribbella rubisoli]
MAPDSVADHSLGRLSSWFRVHQDRVTLRELLEESPLAPILEEIGYVSTHGDEPDLWLEAFAGFGLGGFADEALACEAGDCVGDFDGAGFEVDLVPEVGEGLADADAGAEHKGGEVGEVGFVGSFVCGEAFAEEGDFFAGEGAGWVLGWGFDGVDFADGVDGECAVADGEFLAGRSSTPRSRRKGYWVTIDEGRQVYGRSLARADDGFATWPRQNRGRLESLDDEVDAE